MIFIYVCMLSICVGFLAVFIGDVIDFFRRRDKFDEEGAVKFNNKNYKFEDRRWVTSERETLKIMANIMGHLILALSKKGVISGRDLKLCRLDLLDEIGVNGGIIFDKDGSEKDERQSASEG